MTNKTRKHIWPGGLLMAIAIMGVLAVVVLANNPGAAVAHEDADHETACANMTDDERRAHNVDENLLALQEDRAPNLCMDPSATTTTTTTTPAGANEDPVAIAGVLSDVVLLISTTSDSIDVSTAFEDADGDTLTYTVKSDNPSAVGVTIIDGMVTIVAGANRGMANITVTANDGKGGTASVTFTVTVTEVYTLTASPGAPGAPETYLVAALGPYVAKFNLAVSGSEDDVTVTVTASEPEEGDPFEGGITITDSDGLIGAGFVDEDETDLEGSLTVKATDAGSRAFRIEGQCLLLGAMADIVVEDKDLDVVAEGVILCAEPDEPPPPPDTSTESECYSITGSMDENEAMDQMRDDIEPHTRPAHPTNPEMGQDTIEILEGSADVQITVTSCEAGPVYIRFLDSDGDVFGTDVDECETCEGASGADVVGLDSQQKLELNIGSTEMDAGSIEMDAYMALKYDQYNVVTPGDGSDKYLVGKPGMYYQGAFRFIAPCDWEPFKVEVYEKNGKVLQELENGMFSQTISCVAAEQAEAQPIEVVQGSRADREVIVRWQPIVDAVEYTVAVLDTSDPAMYTVPYVAMFDASATRETTVTGLTSGTRYIYAVYAELPDGSYSPVEFVINTPEF